MRTRTPYLGWEVFLTGPEERRQDVFSVLRERKPWHFSQDKRFTKTKTGGSQQKESLYILRRGVKPVRYRCRTLRGSFLKR